MPRCDICVGCWFYRREINPKSAEFELLRKYCHGAYMECVRYQFAKSLGMRKFPKWLEPSDSRTTKGFNRISINWPSSGIITVTLGYPRPHLLHTDRILDLPKVVLPFSSFTCFFVLELASYFSCSKHDSLQSADFLLHFSTHCIALESSAQYQS